MMIHTGCGLGAGTGGAETVATPKAAPVSPWDSTCPPGMSHRPSDGVCVYTAYDPPAGTVPPIGPDTRIAETGEIVTDEMVHDKILGLEPMMAGLIVAASIGAWLLWRSKRS